MTSILTRGNEVRVNTYTTSYQYLPEITTLSNGSYVISWSSYGQDGSDYGVYFQLYDIFGNKFGAQKRVNTTTLNAQQRCSIVALEGGGFVICWEGYGAQVNTDVYGIFFQVYDAQGVEIRSETLADTSVSYDQENCAVTAMPGGGFAISWSSYGQDADNSRGLFMRLFSEVGTAYTGEIAVNEIPEHSEEYSSIATLNDGTIVVTWSEHSSDVYNLYDIHMRRFSNTGVALTGDIVVNSTTSFVQAVPCVKSLPNGGYIVTWYGNGALSNSEDDHEIYYQMFDANNNMIGGETLVNTTTAYDQRHPSITILSDGGFVIVWQSYPLNTVSEAGIFGQRFDENGIKIGPEFQVNSFDPSFQLTPSVSALSDGGFVVTWSSNGQDGDGYGIYSRRYGPATTLSGTQYLYGTTGGDFLDGGIGSDYMYGGQGDDTYVVNAIGDVVGEDADQGTDMVQTNITYSLSGTQVEQLYLLGNGAIGGTGNELDNLIVGNASNNSLSGLEGIDTLFGGLGNDTVNGGAGDDFIYAEGGNDQINGGDDQDYIEGGDGSDAIEGGAGNDTLFGGNGLDTLLGGEGDDVAYGGDNDDYFYISEGIDRLYGDAGVDTLDATFANGAIDINLAAGRLRYLSIYSSLSGIENVIGGDGNDRLVGDTGNNVLNGGRGVDIMAGGLGDDIYYYDTVGDSVIEYDGQGDDLLYSSINVALGNRSVETVIMLGESNLTFSANAQATEVWGNMGNNIFQSGLGADTVYGGSGNDTYYIDDAGDLTIESAGQGEDVVYSTLSHTLSENVEVLYLSGTGNLNGTGNTLANVIWGNSGNNRLDGGLGNASDSLRGGLGNDTYVFNLGFGYDIITSESGGADTILFGAGITSAMIITADVGADRYYAIAQGGLAANQCANRIRIVGGASGTIETIAYTPPAAPALAPAASSAQLTQAMASLSAPVASIEITPTTASQPQRSTLATNAALPHFWAA